MSQIYKVVLLGESGVGKTCIINYFVTKKFDSDCGINPKKNKLIFYLIKLQLIYSNKIK